MHEDHLLKGSCVSPMQALVAGSVSGAVARYVKKIWPYSVCESHLSESVKHQ